jgi:glucose-1-phosphate cytidylyltransferase
MAKVLILCGGQGTRLREESEYRPKPLVDIGGRPILWHIMKLYAHYAYRDFVLALGYKGNLIKEYFLNYEAMNNDFTIHLGSQKQISYHNFHGERDFSVTLADTGQTAMTGSRLKQLQKYTDDELCLVTYGDGVSDIDIGKLIAFHKSHGRLATMTTVHPTSRFGVVNIDQHQIVTDFVEKPTSSGWASAGFFVFEPGVFEYLTNDETCILEEEPLRKLALDGQLAAYQHEGFFFAMDTYREYLKLNELWQSGEAPWAVWERDRRMSSLHPPADRIPVRT